MWDLRVNNADPQETMLGHETQHLCLLQTSGSAVIHPGDVVHTQPVHLVHSPEKSLLCVESSPVASLSLRKD
jgi:hypothetical protein